MQIELDQAKAVIERFKALIPTDKAQAFAPEFTAACEVLDRLDPVAFHGTEGWLKDHDIKISDWKRRVGEQRSAPGNPESSSAPAVEAQPEPWDDPVNGDDLLFAIYDFLTRFLVTTPEAFIAITLWAVLTHCLDAARRATRLAITSPAPETGKTTLLELLSALVARAFLSSNITGPLAFRIIDKEHPTLLIDEADSFAMQDETLRGILNSGHSRKGVAHRLELNKDTNKWEPVGFCTFGAAAIAGIGEQPATWMSRAIHIKMVRKAANHDVEELGDWNDMASAEAKVLVRKIIRWRDDNLGAIKAVRPIFPAGFGNRLAMNWHTMFAIAEVAGGKWPERAREAAGKLSANRASARTPSERLLADLKAVFKEHKIIGAVASKTVCKHLVDAGGEWTEMPDSHKPITETQLAALLKGYGIEPHSVRVGKWTGRGYHAAVDFGDAFGRYVGSPYSPRSGHHTTTILVSVGEDGIQGTTSAATSPPQSGEEPPRADGRRLTPERLAELRAEVAAITSDAEIGRRADADAATESEPEWNDHVEDDPEVSF